MLYNKKTLNSSRTIHSLFIDLQCVSYHPLCPKINDLNLMQRVSYHSLSCWLRRNGFKIASRSIGVREAAGFQLAYISCFSRGFSDDAQMSFVINLWYVKVKEKNACVYPFLDWSDGWLCSDRINNVDLCRGPTRLVNSLAWNLLETIFFRDSREDFSTSTPYHRLQCSTHPAVDTCQPVVIFFLSTYVSMGTLSARHV